MSNTITGAKGITFSGETFIVPETHDMVKTLFDPTIKKSLFEMLIVAVLVINFGSVFFIADNSVRINCFIGFYIFWRFSYDFGIGYVLRQQSLHNLLVKWCKDHEIFDNNNKGFLSKILKFEIKSQMNKHYKISDYPIEFNTWLIFRRFVDLILMSDFINFIGLFIVCSMNNDFQAINFDQQNEWLVYFRLIFGSFLIIFNYWVKVNAHNTIKDYAWYWGDFFFRQINNEDLIFDGVFEMVPHPMYSVGYIGYYGFALISKSYTVLILACFGHFLQMVFLHFIENPHIDKIYGPSSNEIDVLKLVKLKDLKHFDNAKPMIGLWNFNILRGSDILNLINILTYSVILPSILYLINNNNIFLSFSISSYEVNIDSITFLFGLTIIIKLFESFSINILLILQSNYKSFTKYYLSNDIPVEKSLNNFAIIYNSFISLTYSSFFGLNFFIYLSGYNTRDLIFNDWFYLRNFIGILLILTHVWINTSIIDSIGYFGWFYGDFFIPKSSLPHKANLTKAGVYRYLNNPEQIFGVCGIMGVFIIIPNFANLILCGLWVLNNFIRINCIEKFHMIKLYGEQEVLKDSGVTKTFKKHLIPEVIQRRLSNNHDDEIGERNDLLKQHRRKSSIVATATDTIDQIIKELKKSNTKLTKQNIYELSQNLYFENTDYKINVLNLNHSNEDDHNLLKYIEVGEPIKIGFKCPEVHSDKDWIGLYKIVQTSYSRYKTLISSNNRWHWVKPNETEGTLTFQKDELFWEEGIYEFRYHLDGKHDVAYISEPFEIKIPRFEVPNSSEDIYNFSKILKLEIFDQFIEIENINLPINEKFENADNFLRSYKTLAAVISTATNIKISEKIFLYNEDLSILKLSSKLVHMKKVLGELSNEIEE